MEPVNLKGFLRRAKPYERWPAPLNPMLRDAVVLSGVSIVVMVALLLIRPPLLSFANWAFARFPDFHSVVLDILHQTRSFLLMLNLLSALVYVILWLCTQGLRSGQAIWHQVAFAETVVGAMNGFIVGLELAVLLFPLWKLILLVVGIGVIIAIINPRICIPTEDLSEVEKNLRPIVGERAKGGKP